jgi:hypothetical protein
MGIFAYGDTRCFSVVKRATGNLIDFFDVETGGAAVYTTANSVATTSATSMYFRNRLYIFFNTATLAPGVNYDGSTFAVTGYTGSSLTPVAGTVFKNRAYLVQLDAASYWYSEIDAVTGACTSVDLSGITEQKTTLSCIASFTLSDQSTTEEIMTFIMGNGEVLFYTGSYPDSPTWGLAGKAKIGNPVGYNSTIKYQGDTLVLCDSGVVSLRELFLRGATASQQVSINSRIQNSWKTLVTAARAFFGTSAGPIIPNTSGGIVGNIRGVYETSTDRIIITFPCGFFTSGAFDLLINTYFIFDTLLQSWTIHNTQTNSAGANYGNVNDICYYKNKTRVLYQVSPAPANSYVTVGTKEGATSSSSFPFDDLNPTELAAAGDAIPYNYKMVTAPIPMSKTQVTLLTGFEVILKTDTYIGTTRNSWKLIGDFGAIETTTQQSQPVNTNIYKTLVNVGIEANYVQIELAGGTQQSPPATVGLNLYAMNIWHDNGEKGSR